MNQLKQYLRALHGQIIDIYQNYGVMAVLVNQTMCLVLFDICDVEGNKNKTNNLSDFCQVGDFINADAILGVSESDNTELKIRYFASKVWLQLDDTKNKTTPSLLRKDVSMEKENNFQIVRKLLQKRIEKEKGVINDTNYWLRE